VTFTLGRKGIKQRGNRLRKRCLLNVDLYHRQCSYLIVAGIIATGRPGVN